MARHTPEPSMDAPDYMVDADYDQPRKLFDVTQVVGSVYSGGSADPLVSAMIIIGEALAESSEAPKGVYSFPTEDGLTVSVTIQTSQPKDN